ncbi:hypothetical protein L1885_18050 [Streptomyces fuscigenes]|nr:hypothetical protein [Streptomyces fuscigenes]
MTPRPAGDRDRAREAEPPAGAPVRPQASAQASTRVAAPAPQEKGCAVCAALVRQRSEARENGDTRCEQECDAELGAHGHGG